MYLNGARARGRVRTGRRPCGEWGDFAQNSPHGAVWVAIEMGGTPLQDFVHPPRAVYVLGSEDNGLNRPIVEACQCHVALPKWTGRSSSYNVAMAGTLAGKSTLTRSFPRLMRGGLNAMCTRVVVHADRLTGARRSKVERCHFSSWSNWCLKPLRIGCARGFKLSVP